MIKLNKGIWIGIIAGLIGLLGGVGSVVATAGPAGIYIGAGILIVFGGMFYFLYKLFFKPILNTNRLQKTGIAAVAKILEVIDTGVTINNNPQVKLLLELKNSAGQKYNVESKVLVSRLNPGAYKPGMEIPVKIDPANEKNVVMDYSAGNNSPSTTSQNEKTIQAELLKMQEDNQTVLQSGKSARAIIKKYTWLGVNVNGNNPYVQLELEVLPEYAPAFSGSTKGVIAEASVPKYQPGREIFVKYDLFDTSKIVIDHS